MLGMGLRIRVIDMFERQLFDRLFASITKTENINNIKPPGSESRVFLFPECAWSAHISSHAIKANTRGFFLFIFLQTD